MKRRLLLSLIPAALLADTKIKIGQVKAKFAGIIVSMSDGSMQTATIGSGLTLDTSTSIPQLTSVAAQSLTQSFGVAMVRATDGTYTLPIGSIANGALPSGFRLFRNGLYQLQGTDYSIDLTLKVTPLATWDADDTVQANYQHK